VEQDSNTTNSIRTIILAIIFLPIIVWLLRFAYKKNTESGKRTDACKMQCSDSGYPGYSFKWAIFSGPQCECLEN